MVRKIIRKLRSFTKSDPNVGAFLNAKEVIKQAEKEGLSVSEYVDKTGDDKRKIGRVGRVLDYLENFIGIKDDEISVLEIGPGTGRYMEGLISRKLNISRYEIYETANDWRNYLEKNYKTRFNEFISHKPDAVTLKSSANGSIDLVHAHAVFVYLRPLHVMRYVKEMARVARTGGYVFFDYLPDQQLYEDGYMGWTNGIHEWPIFFSDELMKDFTASIGLEIVGQTDEVYGHGITRYICLRKV